MKKSVRVFILLLALAQYVMAQEVVYSFSDAKSRMFDVSRTLKLAEEEERLARVEYAKTTSWWWPRLQADGMYMHLSEKVEVRQPLSQFTDPMTTYLHENFPLGQMLSGLLDEVGKHSLTLPLLPQNITAVGLTAEWIAFSGGKRVFADRIARRSVDIAQINTQQVLAAEQVLLVKRYFGLVLAMQTTRVCHERYRGALAHYEQALKLESEGVVDKATRLLAQVNMRESKRELEHAIIAEQEEQLALKELLAIAEDSVYIVPSSSLSLDEKLPSEITFQELMLSDNYALSILNVDKCIVDEKLRMDQSAYLPDVVVFGKQTLYAQGLPSNLFPRTLIGVGFTWNIFDGLERERQITQSRIAKQSVVWSREQTESELTVVVTGLYTALLRAIEDVNVLNTTISLNEELVRMRKAAFFEGMATSSEVIDAENTLAETRLARLAAYYAYDVTLASILAVCGRMDLLDEYIH